MTSHVDSADGLFAEYTDGAASDGALFYKASPGGAYTLTAHFVGVPQFGSFSGFGIALRDSITGLFTQLVVFNRGTELAPGGYNVALNNITATDATDTPATLTVTSQPVVSPVSASVVPEIWLRVVDTGAAGPTGLTWSYSIDGVHFQFIHATERTVFMAANGPDQVAFALTNASGGVFEPRAATVCDTFTAA